MAINFNPISLPLRIPIGHALHALHLEGVEANLFYYLPYRWKSYLPK
ncbi:MAG: hypothetical protein NBV61_02125 [Algoriphagus sp.]|nr:hypothetical protein [Algoriphagus sp.]